MTSILDPDFHEKYPAELERYLKIKKDFDQWFTSRSVSALVVDAADDFRLRDHKFDDLRVKYIDLAECAVGDHESIGRWLNEHITEDGEASFDALILDNIDRINTGDRDEDEYLEELVWQSLKRDADGYRPITPGRSIPLATLMIAARCHRLPAYLTGRTPLAVMVDTSDKELYG